MLNRVSWVNWACASRDREMRRALDCKNPRILGRLELLLLVLSLLLNIECQSYYTIHIQGYARG